MTFGNRVDPAQPVATVLNVKHYFDAQASFFATMLLRMVISFLIQAITATILFLPAETSRR
jgi:hypothetical protein